MANLTGFNIGANQRGILNIGSTINTPLDTTLRAVTDGLGNASPLQLSTSQVAVQGVTNTNVRSFQVQNLQNQGILSTANDGVVQIGDYSAQGYGAVLSFIRPSGASRAGTFTQNNADLTFTNPNGSFVVRGNGTNPIARFETSAGSPSQVFRENSTIEIGSQGVYISTTANGVGASNSGRGFLFVGVAGQSIHQFNFSAAQNSETSGTLGGINLTSTYSAASGTALYQPLRIAYTINNTGAVTGTATGIFLNATETALNGMTHNLMDLQVGGVSRFSVTNAGTINLNNTASGSSSILGRTNSRITPYNGATGNFELATSNGGSYDMIFYTSSSVERLRIKSSDGLLTFGGTTNAFPALKRNGAALEVRLADDSGFADIGVRNLIMGNINLTSASFQMNYNCTNHRFNNFNGTRLATISGTGFNDVFFVIGANDANASAILQADSTTKGFLLPRMTEAQRLAIAGGTPAVGLIVYQTDASDGLYVYKAGGWTLII